MSSRTLWPRALSARSLAAVATVVLLGLAPTAAAAGVVVVAKDGSGDTDNVTGAVELAAPGDLILVREGNYQTFSHFETGTFVVVDKPLTIVAEGAGAVIGMLRVYNLPAGQEVVLRNLTMTTPKFNDVILEKIGVSDCNGTVIFEDCKATGTAEGVFSSPGFPAAIVSNSDAVTFTRCTLSGGPGLNPASSAFRDDAGPGGPAVRVTDSKVAFHHCTVTGGAAGIDTEGIVASQTGGDAVMVFDNTTVVLGGGSFTGGKGNDGGPPETPEAAAGGDGLVVDGPFALVRLIGVTPEGGAGGTLSGGSSAPDGEGLVVVDGEVETYAEAARGTSMPALLDEGEAGTLGISGTPGELAEIMAGIELIHVQLGGKKGVFNLGGAFIGPIVLGTIPPSGVLEFPVSLAPGTLHGLEGLRIDLQAFTVGSEGFMLGNPTSMVLLAPGL